MPFDLSSAKIEDSFDLDSAEVKAHIPRWPGDTGEQKITTDEEDQSLEARALRGLKGTGEAALSMGTAALSPFLAPASLAGRGIMHKLLPDKVPRSRSYEDTIDDLTYAPRGEIGSKYVGSIGAALQAFPPVGAYVNAPGMIRAGRKAPQPIPKEIPSAKPVEESINRGDLSKQEGLPFTDSVEKIRESQVVDSAQRDMFVEENQLQRSFDPYQEQLQKQADNERLELQRVAEEGRKQQEIDNAFLQRQRVLFQEEQAVKQDAIANQLDSIEQRMLSQERPSTYRGKGELGAIDMEAVKNGLENLVGKRVQLKDGRIGKVVDHKVILIKDLEKQKERLDEIHGQAFQPYMAGQEEFSVASERARMLQNKFITEDYKNWPNTKPTGRYHVEFEDGSTKAFTFGTDIEHVFEGPKRSELGAIDYNAVKSAIKAFQEDPNEAGNVFHAFRGAFRDNEMDQALWNLRDPRSKDTIALMSPTQFHSLAKGRTPHEIADWGPRLYPSIEEGLKSKGGLYDLPYLRIEKNGQVSAHEGRHRMDVFKEQGVELVPVRLHGVRWGSEDAPKKLYSQDSQLVSPNIREMFAQQMPEILTKKLETLNPQRGVLDINALGEAFKKLRVLKSDSPELAPARGAVELDKKKEVVYNSIPRLDPFRPTMDTPEKVVAMLNEPSSKDLTAVQAATAKTIKPGIRSVRVANNNPLVAFAQEKISKMNSAAENMAREFITNKTGVGPIWEKLGKDERVELHRVLKAGDAELRRFSSEELAEAGYTPKQIEFLEKYYKMEDAELDLWNEKRLTIGMDPVKARPGHFRSVFKGDFWSLAMEDGKIVGYVGTDTKAGHNNVIRGLKAKTPGLTFTPMKRRGLAGSYRRSDLAQGMSEMMEWLGKNDPRMEQVRQAIKQVTDQNADAWMGADLHALSKKGIWGNEGNKPWEGDIHKAADEAMKAYLLSWEEAVLSHMNLETNAQLTGLLQNPEVQAKWPNAVDYVNKYSKHMTGTYTSQLGATLNNAIDLTTKAVSFGQLGLSASRGAINQFTKRMGQLTQGFGNMIYMNMQFLQPFMTALPEMYRGGNSVEIGASLTQGFQDAITYVRKNLGEDVTLTDVQKDMFKYAEERGLLTFSEFDDVSRVTQSKVGRATDTAIDINRRAGELATRPSVFFTFVDLLRKHETIPEGEILDTAYNLTQYSMTDYHPTERPLMYRDLGVAGQLAGSLAQFKHSYVNQMAQWIKEFPRKPQMALAGLTAVAVLAGYRGLPGYDDLDSLVKLITNKFGGKQKSIADIVSEYAPEWVSMEAPAFGAASAYTGLNISSRLGSAQLLPESLLEAVSPYMGKAAKIVEHAGQLGTNPRAAQNLATELAPSSIRGLVEDTYSTTPEGMLINKKGQNEYQRSEFDRSARRFGLQSLEEFKARDKVYQAGTNRQVDADRRAKITGEAVMKVTQLGKDWLKSDEFRKLKNEYIQRGGDPKALENNLVKGKIDAKLTAKQRAEGTNPSDVGSIRRYQYYND